MNKHKDILAIFKMNGGRHRRFFDGSSSSVLKQWAFILCFGLGLTTAAVFWSIDRFSYWASLEERAAEVDVSGTFYDQKAVRTILEDYEGKSESAEAILNNIAPVILEEVAPEEGEGEGLEEVSTSTATSTATSTTSS